MLARPAVEKGRHVPDRHNVKELSKDKHAAEEHAKQGRNWVQAGMKTDAEKFSQK